MGQWGQWGHFYVQIDQDDGCTLCNDQGNLDTALCCVDILPVGILSLSEPARERCCSARAIDHHSQVSWCELTRLDESVCMDIDWTAQ